MMIHSSTFSSATLPFKPRIPSCSSRKTTSPSPSQSSPNQSESSGAENAFVNRGLCCCCGRRHFMGSVTAAAAPLLPLHSSNASSDLSPDYKALLNKIHPPRPNWYEEFYAQVMDKTMESYEAEIAGYKSQLFNELKGEGAKEILEIGVGTGPNFRYYVRDSSLRVIGVDPNRAMERYARHAAETAGLLPENFRFLQAVSEAIPLKDASVDAVIGTLVLCSVGDVDRTLREVKRVLKPGCMYLFVEHVAAKEGTTLRLLQNALNPLQQAVADGCHLTRETGKNISRAGFSDVRLSTAFLTDAPLINSHVYGTASK